MMEKRNSEDICPQRKLFRLRKIEEVYSRDIFNKR